VDRVLHQRDLRHDLRRACQVIMQAQHALPGPIVVRPSSVQVITPHNVPPMLFPPTEPRPPSSPPTTNPTSHRRSPTNHKPQQPHQPQATAARTGTPVPKLTAPEAT
jgi:hypothetical protein